MIWIILSVWTLPGIDTVTPMAYHIFGYFSVGTPRGCAMEIGTTLTHFILEEERRFPGATGEFTALLNDIATVAKIISREVNKAGLADILGVTGRRNVSGEAVQKLDEFANETMLKILGPTGRLVGMASEEMEDIYQIPEPYPKGKYVLLFDPLDGSSNIDVNVAVGTIFSIYRRKSAGSQASLEDFLQPGRDQVCAGYVIYGSSTMLVYTTGSGVHGFTLDPSVGEFLLSHENIRIPRKGKIYSINESYARYWHEHTRRYVESVKATHNCRYVGTLVADFHRNLLKGGIFLYPEDTKDPKKPYGKLRLLYEASPMAFLAEQAGGLATTGTERILDIRPTELHQRVPLIVGSAEDVEAYESLCRETAGSSATA